MVAKNEMPNLRKGRGRTKRAKTGDSGTAEKNGC